MRSTATKRRPPPDKAKREYLAPEMLDVLKDAHSLGFYRKVAERVPTVRIFEALSEVRRMTREARIRTSRGSVFASKLKTWLN